MRTNYDEISYNIERLRVMDSGLFQLMFEDDPELAQYVFQILLEDPSLVCVDAKVEYRVINSLQGHDSVFDLYSSLYGNKILILEMQRESRIVALFPRMEFYAAMAFVEALKKGKGYDTMPDVTVIFYTENDLFGKGLPKYTLARCILETEEVVDTHLKIVCINGAYEDTNSELGKLIHDFRQSDVDQILLAPIQSKISRIKFGKEKDKMQIFSDSVWQEVLDRRHDQMMAEVRAEVRNEVRDEVKDEVKNKVEDELKKEMALKMLKNKIPLSQIAACTEFSLEEIEELKKNL
ncbi:hypothetical protein [Dubosiella newyorkensis]|uniref:hypothetical protein n=2 Tax=Dubosiella newyorkensis TaxID=1862672 RepID=UPI0023F459F0|nr:hypothetical protein [Dubosiella newyorkensis]